MPDMGKYTECLAVLELNVLRMALASLRGFQCPHWNTWKLEGSRYTKCKGSFVEQSLETDGYAVSLFNHHMLHLCLNFGSHRTT